MTRRHALSVLAVIAGSGPASGAQFSPYAPGTDYRVVDLSSVRDIICRFPQGTITLKVEDLWKALLDEESSASSTKPPAKPK